MAESFITVNPHRALELTTVLTVEMVRKW